ncbi:MAG: hypothetical protein WC835_01560 [Candidatus Paceibacterota bacterium]|jgi:hypothetical protein
MRTIFAALLALVVAASSGCSTVEKRIESNNKFAVEKVNNACEALSAFPERYAECVSGEKNPFLDCYQEKVTNRVMPSEALAICRVSVDSRGRVEPGVSPNPRTGDEKFGVNPPYRYNGYNGYGGYRGYSGGHNGYGGYGGGDWPRNKTVVNQVGSVFTVQPSQAAQAVPQQPPMTLQSVQCAMGRKEARQLGIDCP